MPYTYDQFTKAAGDSGLLGEFSRDDLDLAQKYPEFGMGILNLKKDYHSATTDEQRLLANTAANQLRSSYGNYTGGANGTSTVPGGKIPGQIDSVLDSLYGYGSFSFDQARPQYAGNPYQEKVDDLLGRLGNYGSFSYGAAPVYDNQYAAQQRELLDKLLNREDFSWSKETDPLWGSYKKSYLREGERATANALAQASAASGGRPSSYAATAAAQAGDYYATKLNDVIPQLYQQAYQRYLDEYSMMQQDLGAVNTQEQLDYQRYLTDLGQYNTDRNFAYNQYLDDFTRLQDQLGAYQQEGQLDYQRYLDELGQWNTDRNFAYGVYSDDYNRLQSTLGALQGQDQVDYNRFLDQLSQQQYREERDYERAWNTDARDYERAQQEQALAQAQVDAILAAGASPSAELLAQARYSNEYARALEQAQKNLATPNVVSGSGGGNSGGDSADNGDSEDVSVYQRLRDMGITTEAEAYEYLLRSGRSRTEAKDLASYFPSWLEGENNTTTPESGDGDSAPVKTRPAGTTTAKYGSSYNTIWQRARTMYDQGKSDQEIADYLDRFGEDQLTDEGLDYIMSSLNLSGYREGK